MIRAAGILALLGVMAASAAPAAEPAEPDPFERQLTRYREFLDYGGYETGVEGLLPKGAVSRWRLSAGVGLTYTDNLDQDRERRDAWWADGSLGLGWERRSSRLLGSADYRISTGLYESSAVSDENTTTHALAGGLRWIASPRVTTYVNGHVGQNLEEGFGGGPTGVAAGFRNRSDEYALSAGYTWRLGASVTHNASYGFSYRNYVSDDAEGEDTRSHRASAGLGWGGGRAGRWSLGYGFGRTEEVSTGERRDNHSGTLGWSRTFLPLADPRPTTVGVSYAVDRGLPGEGDRYWSHGVSVSLGRSWSARTTTSARVGYQWVRPDEGGDERSVTWGLDASHRFSEYTSGTIGVSQGWSYEPASSRTEFTELTKTRRASGALSTRWGRRLTSRVSASVVDAETRVEGAGASDDDYWEASAGADLSAGVGRGGFWGAGYRFSRRMSDAAEDRFRRHRWNGFVRWAWGRVWSVRLSFTHDRERYDDLPQDDYHENRVTAQVNAAW